MGCDMCDMSDKLRKRILELELVCAEVTDERDAMRDLIREEGRKWATHYSDKENYWLKFMAKAE